MSPPCPVCCTIREGRRRWRRRRGDEVQHGAAIVKDLLFEPDVAPYAEDMPPDAAVELHPVYEPLQALQARAPRRALHQPVDRAHHVIAGVGREPLVGDHDPGGVPGRGIERR